MRPTTVLDYLKEHYKDDNFDILKLIDAVDPRAADRALIETEIKEAVNTINTDDFSPTALKNLASKIALSDYRVLRSNAVTNHWHALHLRSVSMDNAVNLQETSLKELGIIAARTRSKNKRRADEYQLYEKDGLMLNGMKNSAGSIIKTHAVNLAKAAPSYAALTEVQKNSICCGLNSIIDLSNSSDSEDSQCSLFTEKAWQELKYHSYVPRTMPGPSAAVEKDLMAIEEVANESAKEAYLVSLDMLKKYAFSVNEPYFEIYTHVLRLMTRKNSILRVNPKACTEEDYLGQVWTPIFASVFDDKSLKMKWGDSVAKSSTTARIQLHKKSRGIIGDRVDMRVIATIDDNDYDVINGEFASAVAREAKFFSDHRKVLRESKLIIDSIAGSPNMPSREMSRILVPSFQACGLDGEVMVLKLAAPGVYTGQYIGSIPVPNKASNLKWLRTKCVPRLLYMKRHAIKNSKLLEKIFNKENRTKRRKSTAMLRSPSYDSEEEVAVRWVRGSWFPSPNVNAKIVIPKNIL